MGAALRSLPPVYDSSIQFEKRIVNSKLRAFTEIAASLRVGGLSLRNHKAKFL